MQKGVRQKPGCVRREWKPSHPSNGMICDLGKESAHLEAKKGTKRRTSRENPTIAIPGLFRRETGERCGETIEKN